MSDYDRNSEIEDTVLEAIGSGPSLNELMGAIHGDDIGDVFIQLIAEVLDVRKTVSERMESLSEAQSLIFDVAKERAALNFD